MNGSTVQVITRAPGERSRRRPGRTETRRLTLQPGELLAQNTNYSLFGGRQGQGGQPAHGPKAFSFTTTGPAPDTTPPTVLSHTAQRLGAIGVARNATITVTFSEPMDKAAAQTAFAITSPSGFNAGIFDWNAAGTEMTFNPDMDFPYGAEVAWRVAMDAEDEAGNPLGITATGTFRVMRINTVTIDYDPQTSGSASSPDYFKNTHFFVGADVGDVGNSGAARRMLIGFNLNSLPEDLNRITFSRLTWYVSGQSGNPFGNLGRLFLERVYIGEEIGLSPAAGPTNPLSKAQYESESLGAPIIISSSNLSPNGVFDVTSFTSLDWQERINRNSKRSQLRLRFEVPNNNDSIHDKIQTSGEGPFALAMLEVTYEYP